MGLRHAGHGCNCEGNSAETHVCFEVGKGVSVCGRGLGDDAERLSFIYTHAKAGFMRIPKRSAREELCKGKMAFIEAQAVNLPS